jgi:hypothetical protein
MSCVVCDGAGCEHCPAVTDTDTPTAELDWTVGYTLDGNSFVLPQRRGEVSEDQQ